MKRKKIEEKKISGFKKNAENFLKELEKISSLFLEKENNFKLTPVQAILFVELFSGKILKSDKGKYYIISDLDLQHFIKQIQTKKITKEDVEKKLKEIEEYFIPKGKPEVNANELFFMLKTNQIPNFNQKEIFEFSHIDSAEKNENNTEDNEDNFLNNFDIASSITDEFEEDKIVISKINKKEEFKKEFKVVIQNINQKKIHINLLQHHKT